MCVVALAVALLTSAFATAGAQESRASQKKSADLVLVNGTIITVDQRDSVAEAVAIKDGKVVAVGSRKKVDAYVRASTKVVDLHGRTVTPGMIDSHIHFSGADALYKLDLSVLQVHNIADVQAKVAAKVAELQPGEWVQGSKWAAVHLAEHRPIYAADLDPVSPNNPVFLLETSYHQATVNSKALELAGITKDTPDPPGGYIDRDTNGNPTGLLKEGAVWMVAAVIPPFTAEQEKAGLKYITREANKVGLTSVLYPGIGADTWKVFKQVRKEGDLTVRCAALWSSPDTMKASRKLIAQISPFTHPGKKKDTMLWSQGVKMFIDGVQDAGTHWSWQEQFTNFTTPNPGWYGEPVMDPALYRRQVRLYHNAGLQVQTHAIGDRAIDWVVNSYKLAEKGKGTKGLRHGVIHCDIPTDQALKTLRWLQRNYDAGYVYTNPDFMWWTEVIAATMGPQLSLREMPYNTYEKRGIRYGFGTDWSVDPMDPKYSIWSAITRDTLVGLYGPHPFGTDECINVHQALRAATRSNARLLYMEKKIGSIEVGKLADIAVWDKDWYSCTTDEIYNMNCEMTLLGGKIVYRANGSPVTVTRAGMLR